MNIVNTLTLRHIKTHKKRSVLTVLAIIVSVAMVTAVFTSAISFIKYFQQATIVLDGTWHARFEDSDYLSHKKIYENDKDIKQYSVRTYLGSADMGSMDGGSNEIFCADDEWFKMRNVVVSNGRYPQNSNEIIVCEGMIQKSNMDMTLGSKIKLKITDDKGKSYYKEFLIVGYTKSEVSATENFPAFAGIDESSFKNIDSAIVYVEYNKLDNSIWDKVDATKEAVGATNHWYHSDLYMYSGIAKNNSILYSLGSFAAILLLIIAVVSIFMIYDSFAVSYQERAKYLGMLASVGATKRQKRKSIYFEGFILGLIGIPLGVASGIGGIAVTFKCIEDVFLDTVMKNVSVPLKCYVNMFVIIGTVIVSALTIFVSSYIPARKASKTNAVEAIRQTNTVKIKKAKKLRTSKLTEKLFGYEGTLAAKNFKRNGRRSRNIVFALFLSVVVFLTSANFSMMFSDVMSASYSMSSDLTIATGYKHFDLLNETVRANSNVESAFVFSEEMSNIDKSYFKDSKAEILEGDSNVAIIFLDNKSFDSYLKELGEKTEEYHDKNNPKAVLQNVSYQKEKGKKISTEPIVDIQGKKINADTFVATDENGKKLYRNLSFTVGLQTTKLWSEESFYYQYTHWPVFIISEDLYESVVTNDADEDYRLAQASIFCDDAEKTKQEIIADIQKRTDGEIKNIYATESGAQAKQMNNLLTIAKVFIYGFITLITIIAIMNIINTISNSMNERRREFAMIRSIGMTPKTFKRMIYLEAIRYGGQSLLFSIPMGVAIHWLLYKSLGNSFDFGFKLHIAPYIAAVVAVFAIIGLALLYSSSKIKNDNIIETLKADIN